MAIIVSDSSSKPAGQISREKVRTAAARLFASRGFARTSMRELAREAEMSLSGLYHHFATKDELLFEIQRDAFERLLRPLKDSVQELSPEAKIAFLIRNHLDVFSDHITEMKALSHEADALEGELGREMRRMRREYYNICLAIIEEFLEHNGVTDISPRVATMSLFGMINWIYTWYHPGSDDSTADLTRQMTTIFLHGLTRDHKGALP